LEEKAETMSTFWMRWLLLAAMFFLSACTAPSMRAPMSSASVGVQLWSPDQQQHWEPVRFPGKKLTSFKLGRHQSRASLQADAMSSASMLRQKVRVEPDQLGRLKFAWHVPELIAGADMGLRDADDSPVRVVLAFEGDRSKFSPRNAMLSELAHVLTGEEMPYATLMYVWCNQRAVDSVIVNPRTDRIQKIVVESGRAHLRQWMEYERDVRADYQKAFGEAPGALVAIGLMTDSDNTRTTTQAWYGDIQLLAK
jgi:hypothetical protein